MHKPLIMLVDDCEITLAVTRQHLEDAGFSVVARSQPLGTTQAIMKMKPDCVLLDVSMPGLPGDELTKCVRQSKLDTKIVLYSAKEENELMKLANECGADGYITKTDDAEELVGKIRIYLFS